MQPLYKTFNYIMPHTKDRTRDDKIFVLRSTLSGRYLLTQDIYLSETDNQR